MNLSEAFRQQATSCAALGSPFMEQLLNMLAEHWPDSTPLAQKFAAFEGISGRQAIRCLCVSRAGFMLWS